MWNKEFRVRNEREWRLTVLQSLKVAGTAQLISTTDPERKHATFFDRQEAIGLIVYQNSKDSNIRRMK